MNLLFAIVDVFAYWIVASVIVGVALGTVRAFREAWAERDLSPRARAYLAEQRRLKR